MSIRYCQRTFFRHQTPQFYENNSVHICFDISDILFLRHFKLRSNGTVISNFPGNTNLSSNIKYRWRKLRGTFLSDFNYKCHEFRCAYLAGFDRSQNSHCDITL